MAINWQIGDRIQNRWEIHNILRGGMGIVYVVYDHEHHGPHAAKTYQSDVISRNPTVAQRFIQEARAWTGLDVHQNVVQARFVERIQGKPYLFLEYVSGGDLSKWIGTLRLTEDLPQVLRFAIQFCNGMIHAFSKGIRAHRDVKPQNCLVTRDGILKVTDFGLAKAFDDLEVDGLRVEPHSLNLGMTRTGVAAGTPTHMAPEQFDDAKHVDIRADIYSFGVMLYQMIMGRLPFEGRSWKEFEWLHKTQEPKLDCQLSEIADVVYKCLAKNPGDRYCDFSEVRGALSVMHEALTGEAAPQPVEGEELNAVSWSDKGASLGNLGRHDEAISCYDRALELNPQNEATWSNKGMALIELGRSEEAAACFEKALQFNPNYEKALVNKANALLALSCNEAALACCDCALELNPNLEQAWNNKAVALYMLGRYEECVACVDRAIELNPQDEKAWFNRGVAMGELDRSGESIASYDRAIELNPRLAQAWFNKAVELVNGFQLYRKALVCFEEARRLGHPQAGSAISRLRTLLDQP